MIRPPMRVNLRVEAALHIVLVVLESGRAV